MDPKIAIRLFIAMGLAFAPILAPVSAATVIVPGTSDMWLAGMPDGSTASGGDVAPTHSPVLVTGVDLSLGALFFAATGGVLEAPGCPPRCNGPDGGLFTSHSGGAQNGISDATAPVNALMGVFLDDNQPDTTPAPSGLDFLVIGTVFETLSPELKQVFFIGDGRTGTGTGDTQIFEVPVGATRLFLGTMDGFGWFNNSGSFTVEVQAVPLPGAIWLLGSGLLVFVGIRKSKTTNAGRPA